jgi:hypothetical protein
MRVCSLDLVATSGGSECGGSTLAESPEWMPASSMCCITPPMTTRLPSATQSTSTSMASARNSSMRIVCVAARSRRRSMRQSHVRARVLVAS